MHDASGNINNKTNLLVLLSLVNTTNSMVRLVDFY